MHAPEEHLPHGIRWDQILGGLLVAFVLLALAARTSHAQVVQPSGADPYGALRCFDVATDGGLPTQLATSLCVGSSGLAPIACFEQVSDTLAFSDLSAVRLCQQATSLAPAVCADRLDDTEELVEDEIVAFCTAATYALVPASGGGAPQCVEAALEETLLTENDAVRLCAGSSDVQPVACYQVGEAELPDAADEQLIELCSLWVLATPGTLYYYGQPSGGYGAPTTISP